VTQVPGRVLIVGRNSFLAGHLIDQLPAAQVRAVGHEAIEQPDVLDGIACVITFARHPLLGKPGYEPATMDPDLRVARRLGASDIPYLMLSTRKVYAPAITPVAEDAATAPADLYGRHKLAAEQRLRDLLGERLTVLRLANIFGYERQPGRRTFLSISLERLQRDGRIHYDMSPFVARDFLPVGHCARMLARIAAAPPGGILNVGSGIALPTGRLALWIIEGYGRGELVIGSPEEREPFVLDVARLTGRYGAPCTWDDLRRSCLDLGRRLAAEG
jgi:dTDP-4-dehydrorhamnose reductase/UDP-glucose 4-epimerase